MMLLIVIVIIITFNVIDIGFDEAGIASETSVKIWCMKVKQS